MPLFYLYIYNLPSMFAMDSLMTWNNTNKSSISKRKAYKVRSLSADSSINYYVYYTGQDIPYNNETNNSNSNNLHCTLTKHQFVSVIWWFPLINHLQQTSVSSDSSFFPLCPLHNLSLSYDTQPPFVPNKPCNCKCFEYEQRLDPFVLVYFCL